MTGDTVSDRAGSWLMALRGTQARRALILILDGALAAAALWVCMLLRFEGEVPEWFATRMPQYAGILVVARIVASRLFRLHRWSFLLSGLPDAMRVGYAGLMGSGMFLLALFFFEIPAPPRSVVVLEFFMSTVAMGLLRFSPRLAWTLHGDRIRGRRRSSLRTLILGAGSAGEMLLRDLQRWRDHDYSIVGFVDDDRTKWGTIVGGKPILGGIDDLAHLVRRYRIGKVLIAIPRLPAERIRQILSLCSELKIRFKILPLSALYLHEQAVASRLKDLSPEDLLQRRPVDFSASEWASAAQGSTALVTGAAGSIGGEICHQLLEAGVARLIMVDINENGLYLLGRRFEQQFPEATVVAEVADVREEGRLRTLFTRYRPEDVFHAAAHKHVPLMEAAPGEAVKNNVGGTLNLARVADEMGSARFVLISTDKAVRPTSVMGATKRVGEILVRQMARRSQTQFTAVRFGNVLDSAGSVVPVFREQIAAGGPVTVTHPEVRRYFMTISEAVGLVLQAAYGGFGTLCVLDMGEPIRIVELARHMITMSGHAPEGEIPIVFTGLRPGEKLYEEVLTEEEEQTRQIADKIFVASSPPPSPQVETMVDRLLRAARDEDANETMRVLRQLVPSYRPMPSEASDPAPVTPIGPRAASSLVLDRRDEKPATVGSGSRSGHPG